jgi:hypothetical protein
MTPLVAGDCIRVRRAAICRVNLALGEHEGEVVVQLEGEVVVQTYLVCPGVWRIRWSNGVFEGHLLLGRGNSRACVCACARACAGCACACRAWGCECAYVIEACRPLATCVRGCGRISANRRETATTTRQWVHGRRRCWARLLGSPVCAGGRRTRARRCGRGCFGGASGVAERDCFGMSNIPTSCCRLAC